MKFVSGQDAMIWYLTVKKIDINLFLHEHAIAETLACSKEMSIDDAVAAVASDIRFKHAVQHGEIEKCMSRPGEGYNIDRIQEEVLIAVDIETMLLKLPLNERRHVFQYAIQGPTKYVPVDVRKALRHFELYLQETDYIITPPEKRRSP